MTITDLRYGPTKNHNLKIFKKKDNRTYFTHLISLSFPPSPFFPPPLCVFVHTQYVCMYVFMSLHLCLRMYMLSCTQAFGGQVLMPCFFLSYSPYFIVLRQGSPTESGLEQFEQIGCSVSTRDSPASTLSILELQVCIATSNALCDFWRLKFIFVITQQVLY